MTSAASGRFARASPAPRWPDLWFPLSVVVVLAFGQGWVMAIVGPVAVVPQDTSAALRNVFFPVYAICLGLALARPFELAAGAWRAPFLVALVALTFVSYLWSIDPEVTARRSIAVLFTTLGGAAVAARYAWPTLLEVLAAGWAIAVAASVAMIVLLPSYGVMSTDFPGAWRGVWPHKNILGYDMALAFVVFVAAALLQPRRRKLWLLFAVAAIVLLAGSQSATSIISCAVAAGAMGLVWLMRRGPAGILGAAWIAAALVVGGVLLFLIDPALPFRLVGKDATLTGRTSIWAAVMRQIAKRPETGYGFGAVWDETSRWGPLPWISREQGFVVNEAHNSWLGVWLELGYAGLACAALALADFWRRAILEAFRSPAAYFVLPFAAIFTLHTVTESTILEQNSLIWMMFVAAAFRLGLPPDRGAQRYSA